MGCQLVNRLCVHQCSLACQHSPVSVGCVCSYICHFEPCFPWRVCLCVCCPTFLPQRVSTPACQIFPALSGCVFICRFAPAPCTESVLASTHARLDNCMCASTNESLTQVLLPQENPTPSEHGFPWFFTEAPLSSFFAISTFSNIVRTMCTFYCTSFCGHIIRPRSFHRCHGEG